MLDKEGESQERSSLAFGLELPISEHQSDHKLGASEVEAASAAMRLTTAVCAPRRHDRGVV